MLFGQDGLAPRPSTTGCKEDSAEPGEDQQGREVERHVLLPQGELDKRARPHHGQFGLGNGLGACRRVGFRLRVGSRCRGQTHRLGRRRDRSVDLNGNGYLDRPKLIRHIGQQILVGQLVGDFGEDPLESGGIGCSDDRAIGRSRQPRQGFRVILGRLQLDRIEGHLLAQHRHQRRLQRGLAHCVAAVGQQDDDSSRSRCGIELLGGDQEAVVERGLASGVEPQDCGRRTIRVAREAAGDCRRVGEGHHGHPYSLGHLVDETERGGLGCGERAPGHAP